jgi:predicted MFS family arabinose efflux permease
MSLPSAHVLRAPAGRAWLYVLAGFSASLLSIGLARFAYAPLVPALIHAQWFPSSSVVFLSAANLTGYLAGALVGQPLARRFSDVQVLRAMMLLVSAAFLACAYPVSVGWFFAWRLMSGVAGGAIMVLVAATVLPHVPQARRGIAGGAIFLGVGVGIAGSGTVVPWLLKMGLQTTWLGLAGISAALALLTWYAWPGHHDRTFDARRVDPQPAGKPYDTRTARAGLVRLFAQYGLMAVALVAPMVFLVDFVERGLHAGAAAGAHVWVLYGLGAIAGPPLYGWLGDWLGARRALRGVLGIQALAMAALAFTEGNGLLAVATLVVGTFPPGIVPLALARVHDLLPHDAAAQNRAWSRATVSFATFQALAGYGYSAAFAATGGQHRVLFGIGAAALAVALLTELQRKRATRS